MLVNFYNDASVLMSNQFVACIRKLNSNSKSGGFPSLVFGISDDFINIPASCLDDDDVDLMLALAVRSEWRQTYLRRLPRGL